MLLDKCSGGRRILWSDGRANQVNQQMGSVELYFETQAQDYQKKCQCWPWKWLRNREARSVITMLDDIRGRSFLEFGCGAGFYSRLLLEAGADHVWALDLSSRMLDQLPAHHITPILGDAAEIQIERQFDRAFSAGLLEFVSDPAMVLANLAGHVLAGGVATVLFPVANIAGFLYRFYHCRHGMFLNLFEINEFINMAQRTGWTVTATNRCGPFSAVVNMRRNS